MLFRGQSWAWGDMTGSVQAQLPVGLSRQRLLVAPGTQGSPVPPQAQSPEVTCYLEPLCLHLHPPPKAMSPPPDNGIADMKTWDCLEEPRAPDAPSFELGERLVYTAPKGQCSEELFN